jgi:hypothetical protein
VSFLKLAQEKILSMVLLEQVYEAVESLQHFVLGRGASDSFSPYSGRLGFS